jgi:hypothetical protein
MPRQYCVQLLNLTTGKTSLYICKANNIYEALKISGVIPKDADVTADTKWETNYKLETLYSEPVD